MSLTKTVAALAVSIGLIMASGIVRGPVEAQNRGAAPGRFAHGRDLRRRH